MLSSYSSPSWLLFLVISLISSLFLIWPEHIIWIISNPLKFVDTFLWPIMWSILENIPYDFERICIYFAVGEVLYICQVHIIRVIELCLSNFYWSFCFLILLFVYQESSVKNLRFWIGVYLFLLGVFQYLCYMYFRLSSVYTH